MKWGVRRYQNEDGTLTEAGKKRLKSYNFNEDGSARTNKHINNILELDKKYANNRTVKQQAKINNEVRKYNESAKRDIQKALKEGNIDSAKSVAAGRTYMAMLTNSRYLNSAISSTASSGKIEAGKDYTYNLVRDNDLGGVRVTVNGHSDFYTLDPFDRK